MADCEFCGSGIDVEAQDMGEERMMLLCASCRANIAAAQERDRETSAMEKLTENPRIWMQRGDTQWTPLDDCPMVRCCVHRRHDDRCNEPAAWGEIRYLDDGGYRLTAFCAVHWDIHIHRAPPTYDIRINGQKYSVPAHALDYRAIVALAWGEAEADGPRLYSVVYSDGPAHNPEGSLTPGEFAILQQDMHFEAMVTGNA